MASVVWILNLGAALELENPSAWEPGAKIRRQLEQFLPRAKHLLGAEDHLLTHNYRLSAELKGCRGRAFCPTPSALSALQKAGATPESAPTFEVLRRVNHRHFGLELGAGVPGARFISDAAELSETLKEARQCPWLFKRPYGFAGRGQRRVTRALSADDERWFAVALKDGIWAEPLVEIEREFSTHGYVSAHGTWRLGQVCVQVVDEYRAWQSARLATVDECEGYRLEGVNLAAERVARALARAGYFGPFGVDAFTWRDQHGLHLNALSEINARYTMGWAIGMAQVSRDEWGLPITTVSV